MTRSWRRQLWRATLDSMRPGGGDDTPGDDDAIAAAVEAADGPGPFGHGTIRLCGARPPHARRPAAVAPVAGVQYAASAVAAKWAGHGAIRLLAPSPGENVVVAMPEPTDPAGDPGLPSQPRAA